MNSDTIRGILTNLCSPQLTQVSRAERGGEVSATDIANVVGYSVVIGLVTGDERFELGLAKNSNLKRLEFSSRRRKRTALITHLPTYRLETHPRRQRVLT